MTSGPHTTGPGAGGTPEDGDLFIPETRDEEVDLSDVRPEDIVNLLVFWALAGVVFLQFFTRYVLNNSIGWTEEIARYLLIGVGFLGSVIAVRKNTHIAVQFFYRYLSVNVGRALSTLVDIGNIAFYAMATWICIKLSLRTRQYMTSVDLPKSVVYWVVAVGFVGMTIYAVIVAIRHWRQGYSDLTRPTGAIKTTD
ncbi:MAG: TRAP transporter small permease [Oceanibaculum sp.]